MSVDLFADFVRPQAARFEAARKPAWITDAIITAAWPRFIAKVDACDACACWFWLGARSHGQGNTAPYGSFYVCRGVIVRAHIFAAAAAGIDVPKGHHRDHFSCPAHPLRTLCVNPFHLDPCTPRENSLRRWRSTPTLFARAA